jgi:8-oxo-dGTP pyrophosphatase MutT (NUDIX family)
VAALVIDGDDILLARQYRHPVGRWIYDLPAGAAEDGELPDAAVGREIEEELGVIAADLRPLHTFWMNPGRSAWATHIFVCTIDAEPGTVDVSDPAEQVRLARVPLRELDRLIADGEIIDPTLLIARTMAAVRGILPPLGA